MPTKPPNQSKRWNLTVQYMIASLIILVIVALGLGWWIEREIEASVVHRTAETTALFVDSFISPNLQELGSADLLTPEHVDALNRLLVDTPLGQHIVSFKIWNLNGKVLYSSDPAIIGQVFPVAEGLAEAMNGNVSSHISDLEKEENALERVQETELLETYSPVRVSGSGKVIAVAEFYQSVKGLEQDITNAQRRSWLMVGAAMLFSYLLLSGFVIRASDTIDQQQVALGRQVHQLTDLLTQNRGLHERVRRAAARTTALNERILRRISADLHDGPVQDLGLALLRLDHVSARVPVSTVDGYDSFSLEADLDVVQGSIERALTEIRSLSAGMGVPHLSELTLPETLARAIHIHKQRTQTEVQLELLQVPEQTSLPVKITVFRQVQEALNNAYRHGGGLGQRVTAYCSEDWLHIEVSDRGPGFSQQREIVWEDHLGLIGMRERVESLGGIFRVESVPNQGTRVIADLPVQEMEKSYGQSNSSITG